jgi:hypothetical protein
LHHGFIVSDRRDARAGRGVRVNQLH